MKLTFLDATSRQLVVFLLCMVSNLTSMNLWCHLRIVCRFQYAFWRRCHNKESPRPKAATRRPLNKPKRMNLRKGFALSEQIQSGVLCRRSEETEALQTHAVSSVVDLLKAGVSLAKSLHQ